MLVKLSYKESWLCWLQLSFKPESCLPGEWVKEQDGWFLILLLFFLWCLLSSPLCPTLVWTHKHSKPLSFLSKSALCQPALCHPCQQPGSHGGEHSLTAPHSLLHTYSHANRHIQGCDTSNFYTARVLFAKPALLGGGVCCGKSSKKFRFTGKIRWIWVCASHRKRSSVFTKLSCMQRGIS